MIKSTVEFREEIERRKARILKFIECRPGCTLKDVYSVYGSYSNYHNGEETRIAFEELGIKEIRRYAAAVHVEVEHINGTIYALLLNYRDLEEALSET